MKITRYFNLFYFIIILIVIIFIINYFYSKNENAIPFPEKKEFKKSIEVIISRYNEDLKWTLESPFNKYKYIVYNKGDNEDFEKTNVISSINIKNQGKCDHTYLYHVVHNYDYLADIIIFLPGCLNENYYKVSKTILLLELIDKYNEAFFIYDYKSDTSILSDYYYLKIDDYTSISKVNADKNSEVIFRKSKIRPFGKWYNSNFDYNINYVSFFGIFSLNRKDIYNHKKQIYFKYMKSLEGAINDELSHYFERSWEAIVYPMNYTYKLNYTNKITTFIQKYFANYIKEKKKNYTLDCSAMPRIGPPYWNFIYFVNKYTYHYL